MHTIRWLFYLARLVIYRVLGVLRFFSKPGSRIIVPSGLIGLAVLMRPELHYQLRLAVWEQNRALDPHWLALDAVIAMAGVLLICLYVLASRLLATLLGAFPVPQRPLPPLRRLMPTVQAVTSVPVRIVVPALRRQRA